MPFTPTRALFLTLTLLLGLLASNVTTLPALAQNDAAKFDAALSSRASTRPEAGPFAGELDQLGPRGRLRHRLLSLRHCHKPAC